MRKVRLTGIYKAVATAGTQLRVSAVDLKVPYLVITTESTNTGGIYIGGPEVGVTANDMFAELDSGQGIVIDPEKLGIKGYINLKDVYIDSEVSGDGAYFGFLKVEDDHP